MLAVSLTAAPPAAPAPSLDVLRQALDPNPGLATYAAATSLSAVLHAGIAVHETFEGTAYYRKPVLKVEFRNVPPEFKRFSELDTSLPTYEEVLRDYQAAPPADDGTTYSVVLTPNKRDGRVQSLTLRVDDATRLVSQAAWAYKSGESLVMSPAYATNAEYHVFSTLAITARFDAYNVDGTLRFSDYRLNVSVPI